MREADNDDGVDIMLLSASIVVVFVDSFVTVEVRRGEVVNANDVGGHIDAATMTMDTISMNNIMCGGGGGLGFTWYLVRPTYDAALGAPPLHAFALATSPRAVLLAGISWRFMDGFSTSSYVEFPVFTKKVS